MTSSSKLATVLAVTAGLALTLIAPGTATATAGQARGNAASISVDGQATDGGSDPATSIPGKYPWT